MWALAAVMTVGCGPASEEDTELPVPPQPGSETPIAFSGNLPEEGSGSVTRTEPRGLETVLPEGNKKFQVWAFKTVGNSTSVQIVIDGYIVKWIANSANTTTSNSSNWEYVNQGTNQSIKYWDYSASAYRFFGVAGAGSANSIRGAYKPSDDNPQRYELVYESDATNPAATPYYSHLWVGESDRYGLPVRLEFIQPLSKVRFKFIFEDPTQASTTELTAKSFRPTNGTSIKMKGDVSVSYPLSGDASETFAATAEAEGMTDFTLDYYESVGYDNSNPSKVIEPYLGADATKTGQEYSVLPVSGQGTYTLTVSVNGEPKTTVVPAEFMEWKPGYQYTYIFKVHVDKGVSISSVQAAFTTWSFYATDHTVYNW